MPAFEFLTMGFVFPETFFLVLPTTFFVLHRSLSTDITLFIFPLPSPFPSLVLSLGGETTPILRSIRLITDAGFDAASANTDKF